MSELFREGAVSRKPRSILGEVRIGAPLSHTVWAAAIALLLAVVLVWMVIGQYSRRETASGILVPKGGLATIRSHATGVVHKLFVAEGDGIQEGQIIAEVSADQRSSVSSSSADNEKDRISREIILLNADLDALIQEDVIKIGNLKLQILQLGSEISSAQQQLASYRQELVAQGELLSKYQSLAGDNYVSGSQILDQKTRVYQASARVSQQDAAISSLIRLRSELRQRLSLQPIEIAARRNETERRIGQLEESLYGTELQKRNLIVATRDGSIATLSIKLGDTVSSGSQIATIAPERSPLVAQLYVPTSGIGFVSVGNRVALRYAAFPHQKFGVHSGRVISVSGSPLPAEELQAAGFAQAADDRQQTFYRVLVEIERQQVATTGDPRPLLAGMAVDGEIILEKRRIYEWLFEPVIKAAKWN